MYDVITIGAATQDVFLQSKGFHLLHSPRLKRTCECFPLGEKINVERIDFATGGGATNAAATFCNLGFKTTAVAKGGYDSSGEAVREGLRVGRFTVSWVARGKKRNDRLFRHSFDCARRSHRAYSSGRIGTDWRRGYSMEKSLCPLDFCHVACGEYETVETPVYGGVRARLSDCI